MQERSSLDSCFWTSRTSSRSGGNTAIGLGHIVTGGLLWLKIQETREAIERHIKELRESLTAV